MLKSKDRHFSFDETLWNLPNTRTLTPEEKLTRISTHTYPHAIPPPQLPSVIAIEGYACPATGVFRDIASEDNVIWQYHGSKGEDMGTYWGDKYSRNGWVDDRATSRHGVSSRPSGAAMGEG